MNTTWSRSTKYIVGVGLALGGIFILYLCRPIIPLLVVAALIAAIIRPVIGWLHHSCRLHRGVAVGLAYLGLAVLAPLVVMLTLPAIHDTLAYVGSLDYQSILHRAMEWLGATLITIKTAQLPMAGFDAYVDRAVDSLLEALQRFSPQAAAPPSPDTTLQQISSTLMSVMEAGVNLVGVVVSNAAKIVFMFLASIYISLGAHSYRDGFLKAAPAAYQPEIANLLARIERVWNAYFLGELKLMLVIGAITSIGLAALGMPGALYLGIIAGLLEIVPNIGPIIATVPAVIVALIQGSAYLPISHLSFALLVILFYILVQQVENNLVVPRVLGDALDLPPLIVMTGLVVGASAGGMLGALLATPVIASAREMLSYVRAKLQDQDPIQPIEAVAPQTGARPFGNWQFPLPARLQAIIASRRSVAQRGSEKE